MWGGKSKLVDIVEKKKINREILEEEIKRASTGSVKQTKKKSCKTFVGEKNKC